jgi:hypothetical protein
MKLKKIIEIADSHYPDHKIMEHFKARQDNTACLDEIGDGLAGFIVSELCSIYDETASSNQQQVEIRRALNDAVSELRAVANAF